jgi:hypothetical protein
VWNGALRAGGEGMKTLLPAGRSLLSALTLSILPLALVLPAACTGDDVEEEPGKGGSAGKGGASRGGASGSAGKGGSGARDGGAPGAGAAGQGDGGSMDPNGRGGEAGFGGGAGFAGEGGFGGEAGFSGEAGFGGEGGFGVYEGPSVGRARTFAALAYSSITTANVSTVTGELGVSAGALSTITGFDAATYTKYGSDSLAPNAQRTLLAQQDATALVGDIDPRPCDQDLTNVLGGLTGDITLHPGVTCMNSFTADVLVDGHVYLDAGGDPNAFFIIRGNMSLTVANGAQVVLMNGAQACGVFWRISKEVSMGTTVKFIGTVVSGTAITMKSGSTLNGRALAQTAGVQLDANTITIPAACTHVQ